MSTDYTKFVDKAENVAKTNGHEYVTVDHLFYVLLQEKEIQDVIDEAATQCKSSDNSVDIINNFNMCFRNGKDEFGESFGSNPKRSSTLEDLLNQFNQLQLMKNSLPDDMAVINFGTYEIFAELCTYRDTFAEFILENSNIEREVILSILEKKAKQNMTSTNANVEGDEALEKYTVNMTERAKQGKLGKMIGREKELDQLTEILARKNKSNACLNGDPGVGKSQIIEGLAQTIADGTCHDSLKDVDILSVDITAMMAGAKYRGDFEARLKAVMDAVSDDPTKILFIDEMHNMMGAGSSKDGSMDMANIMKPKLSRGEIRVIGSTTEEEYKKHIEKDKAMARRFMAVKVVEPSVEDTVKILEGLAESYGDFHDVKYTVESLRAAAELSDKFIQNKCLPDKAIDVMDWAGATNKVSKKPQKTITLRLVQDKVSEISGIPVEMMSKKEDKEPVDLSEYMQKRVFGQNKALDTLATSVELSLAGLADAEGTMGNFVFTGPTGTGKTEAAKALAEAMGVSLVRINMNDYMEKHAVSTLIGAPAGYVGYEEGSHGVLIDKIEKNPNCVLLLDEMEKAHKDVQNVFLQAFDEGFVTSRKDKKVSLKNVVVILTTNAGAALADKKSMTPGSASGSAMDAALKKVMTPEMRNRITEVVKFEQLNEVNMGKVVDKFVKEIQDASLASKVSVTLDSSARDFIINKAIPLNMGGRPVKRLLRKHVKQTLAKEMLRGSLKDGGTVEFTVNEDGTDLKIK